MTNRINVCFCIDNNYVSQLGAVLYSLIDSNSMNEVRVYVISSDVLEVSKESLSEIIKKIENFSIEFIDVFDKNLLSLEAGGHISSATFIRFSIPELLNSIDKVLYLDADLIIKDDLVKFWDVDLEDSYVCAVDNPLFGRYESLFMDDDWGYFNAGVMIMNLPLWRKDNIKEQALEFLSGHKDVAIMFDQDALNSVMHGKWIKADIRWNLQTVFLRKKRDLILDFKELNDSISNPGIIHYSTSSKPWQLLDPHPLRYCYLENEEKFQKVPRIYKGFFKSIVRYIYVRLVFAYQGL